MSTSPGLVEHAQKLSTFGEFLTFARIVKCISKSSIIYALYYKNEDIRLRNED